MRSQSNELTPTPCNCSLFTCLTSLELLSNTLSPFSKVKTPSPFSYYLLLPTPYSQPSLSFPSSDSSSLTPKTLSSSNKPSKSLLSILLHSHNLLSVNIVSYHWGYNLLMSPQNSLLACEALFIAPLCFYIFGDRMIVLF